MTNEQSLTPTPEMLVEKLRADSATLLRVAEMLSLNRDAVALIAQRVAKLPIGEEAALGLVRIMFEVLREFAHDMSEACDDTESGKVEARVVIFHEGTKH